MKESSQGPPGKDADPTMCFPVGSVYVTMKETDPATMLGFGKWEQIKSGSVKAYFWGRVE